VNLLQLQNKLKLKKLFFSVVLGAIVWLFWLRCCFESICGYHWLQNFLKATEENMGGKRKRSEAAKEKRALKKKRRKKNITLSFPYTNGQKKNISQTVVSLTTPTIVRDLRNETLIHLWKGIIPTELLEQLELSLQQLQRELPPHKKITNRGEENTYHLGCWRKFTMKPTITKQTRHSSAREFLIKNTKLFELVSNIFKERYPEMYKIYESVSMPEKLVGVFGTVAINVNYATTPHFDFDDFANGFCWVLSFGHYDGGDLNFLPLNMKAVLKPGDLIAFKSRQIEHGNEHYTGDRFSLVFFTNHEMFFDSQK
jgi:hypothetical protein